MPETAPNPQQQAAAQQLVHAFLSDLAAGRPDDAVAVLADDVVYTNVGLATLRGRDRAGRALRLLNRRGAGFDVQVLCSVGEGPKVMTERIDELRLGPLAVRFWVCGRFDVHDGRITLWRDYFDNLDIAKGVLRGLVALVLPAAQRPLTPLARAGES